MGIREKFFELTSQQRRLAVLAVAVVFTLLLCGALIPNKLKAYNASKNSYNEAEKAAKLVVRTNGNIEENTKKGKLLSTQEVQQLRLNGNELLAESDIKEFLEILNEINERLGGHEIRIEEGMTTDAYMKLGPGGNAYKVSKLPVKIVFNSSYATLSNYLFQLHGMKRFIKLGNIEINNIGYSGDIRVTLKAGIFYLEGS